MNGLELTTYDPTCEALSIIYGTMESQSDTFKSFVRTGVLMESGIPTDIVMESAGDMILSIVDGIKKFIQKVKEFFKRVLLYITSSFQELDKLAKEVKEVLASKTDIDFEITGYKFTVLEKTGPNMEEFKKIVSEYNSDIDRLNEIKKVDIISSMTKWMDDDNVNKIRAQVLGVKDSISEDDFLETVRSHFRGGEESTQTIKVTLSTVNEIVGHAKRLEEAKRSSIKDRDELITLLSKTEEFFNKKVYSYYRGSSKQSDVRKVNVDDNKFRTSENNIKMNDDMSKTLSSYASYKAKQVNKIGSIINLVACERVNALKDQIKQERDILKRCLFGDTSSKSTEQKAIEDSTIFHDVGINGLDYPVIAMESNIRDFNMYEELRNSTLLEEARFIVESVNSGEVYYLMEADTRYLATRIKNAIAEIIESLVKQFREKAIGNVEKYKPWLEEIRGGLKEKAAAKKELSMANFLDADYNNMAKQIQTSINKAYKTTNYTDVSFATTILDDIRTMDDLTDPHLRGMLLNYFRTGNADEKLDTKTMDGKELASKIDEIIRYIETYASAVTTPVRAISNTLKTATAGFKVTESMITGNTYLDVISTPVCESDIALCRDYNEIFNPVTEDAQIGGDGKNVVAGKKENGAQESNKSNKNAADAASNESKNGDEIKSATTVQSEDDKNVENGIKEKKTNNEALAYKRAADGFFKYCISLYLKAREEQFLAYVNVLANIDGKKPKFDKNGKYISKEKQKKEAAKEQEEENVTKPESK